MKLKLKIGLVVVSVLGSFLGIFGNSAAGWAADRVQVISKIGSNDPKSFDATQASEKYVAVSAVTDSSGLKAIRYGGQLIPLSQLNENGTVLFKVSVGPMSWDVVTIQKGWPAQMNSTDEAPEIDPRTAQFGPTGGKITLNYMSEAGIVGDSDYKHLRLELQPTSDGRFKLVTAEGRSAAYLYAVKRPDGQGIQSLQIKSASEFAALTGIHEVNRAPAITDQQDKVFSSVDGSADTPSSAQEVSSGR